MGRALQGSSKLATSITTLYCKHSNKKVEITRATNTIKNGKAAGPNGIPPEALKTTPTKCAEMLQPLLRKIGKDEKIQMLGKQDTLVNY